MNTDVTPVLFRYLHVDNNGASQFYGEVNIPPSAPYTPHRYHTAGSMIP